MNYNDLRQFADSWGLLFMTIAYLAFVGWVFLPRNRDRNDRAARMIFDHDSKGERDHG